MVSLIGGAKIRVSSVLDKDVRSFGKHHLTDGNEDTCWNSNQGIPQWIHVEFADLVLPTDLWLQFQGGFAGREMHLELQGPLDTVPRVADFYPEDSNTVQISFLC